MRVFITGASGFIGRALADRYRADGHEVVGMDLIGDPAGGVVAGDVGTPGAWQDHARECDLVIHTAAVVSFRLQDRAGTWRANVVGTRNALEAAERGGASRFVHFSSITVFGFEFPDGVTERDPVRLTGVPYPDTKIASEQVVLQAHAEGRVPCTVIRPGDVFGPRSRPWAIMPVELIRSRRIEGVLTLNTDGAAAVLDATQTTPIARRPRIATFDLSPEVLRALQAGISAFRGG